MTTNEQITPIISVVRGHVVAGSSFIPFKLEVLAVRYSLREYPKVQLQSSHSWSLQYYTNNAGANITILDQKHNALKELDVGGNLTYKIQVYISKLFCNKTSQYEHSTYASNHTLEYLDGVEHHTLLNLLLEMNRGTNKSHVAMKKVLSYHPNIDMRQCLNGI